MKIVLERILVPTDFSAESRAALTYGVGLAETFGAALHILHVLEMIAGAEPLIWKIDQRKPIESAIEASAWEELGRLLSEEERTALHAELALEWGSPFVEIIRYAKAHAIDLIVMGTHGRGGVKHVIIGCGRKRGPQRAVSGADRPASRTRVRAALKRKTRPDGAVVVFSRPWRAGRIRRRSAAGRKAGQYTWW
jgi:nucleotide-binding universal stress UspA family protein